VGVGRNDGRHTAEVACADVDTCRVVGEKWSPRVVQELQLVVPAEEDTGMRLLDKDSAEEAGVEEAGVKEEVL